MPGAALGHEVDERLLQRVQRRVVQGLADDAQGRGAGAVARAAIQAGQGPLEVHVGLQLVEDHRGRLLHQVGEEAVVGQGQDLHQVVLQPGELVVGEDEVEGAHQAVAVLDQHGHLGVAGRGVGGQVADAVATGQTVARAGDIVRDHRRGGILGRGGQGLQVKLVGGAIGQALADDVEQLLAEVLAVLPLRVVGHGRRAPRRRPGGQHEEQGQAGPAGGGLGVLLAMRPAWGGGGPPGPPPRPRRPSPTTLLSALVK